MKTLISLSAFVLELHSKACSESDYLRILKKIFNYAEFLSQPLNFGMFVPCKLVNGNWIVLEKPKKEDYIFEEHPELAGNPKEYDDEIYEEDLKKYQEACERVLFEGFEYLGNDLTRGLKLRIDEEFIQGLIMEYLVKYNLTLTQTAIKQIS